MRALGAYMWKEWRDQRAGLIGFALVIPILLAVALLTIPGQWRSADVLPTCVAFAGLFIAMLTVVSDVVPGEERRGRFAFLARLPRDLRGAFVAKVLFVIAALAFCGVYAWFCATSLSAAIGGGKWLAPFDATVRWARVTSFQTSFAQTSLLPAFFALVAWVFAVSCWLPRGTLALPAALLVLATIGGPVIALGLKFPRLPFWLEEIDAFSIWIPTSALVAAALAFLRGARHGRQPRRIVAWAIVGTLFAAAPVWAWTARRGHAYVSFDVANDAFALQPIALGDGGRFVFANVQPRDSGDERSFRRRAIHAVLLDLEDGSLREVGAPDDFFELPNRRSLAIGTAPFVLLGHAIDALRTQQMSWLPIEWIDGFDGRSGERLDSSRWRSLLQDGGALSDAIARARDFLVMPDGSRCWLTSHTLHVEARNGPKRTTTIRELGVDPNMNPRGAGFASWNGVADVSSGRYFSTLALRNTTRQDGKGGAVECMESVVAIRPDSWLVHVAEARPTRADSTPFATYLVRNPDGTDERPAQGIAAGDCIATAFSNGRVLVGPAGDLRWAHPTALALVDPWSGVRIPVSLPDGVPTPGALTHDASLPSGAAVCILQWRGATSNDAPRTRVVRIDRDGSARITAELPITSVLQIVGCPDESTVVVATEDRRIVRAKFDGSPFEVVFPRGTRLIRDERDAPPVGAPK